MYILTRNIHVSIRMYRERVIAYGSYKSAKNGKEGGKEWESGNKRKRKEAYSPFLLILI